MQKNKRMAQNAKCMAYFVITSCAKRSTPWVPLLIFVLTTASGCSYFKPHLTSAELSKRYQYGHDRALEELVDIAMAWGYEAVNGDGQARQVLELQHSGAGSINRQFFEVQPLGEEHLDVFFLENKGSVAESKLSRFPRYLRQTIREFLEGLPEASSTAYRPLRVRQEKLSRRMIVYQTDNGEPAVQFTQHVVSVKKVNCTVSIIFPTGLLFFLENNQRSFFEKIFWKQTTVTKNLYTSSCNFSGRRSSYEIGSPEGRPYPWSQSRQGVNS